MRYISFAIISLALFAIPTIHADDASKPSPAVLDVAKVDGYFVSRRLASVRLGEGGGCSGTIVFIADWDGKETAFGLTANHCGYEKNETVTIWYVDGSKASARCIDADPKSDLMLFAVDASTVLGVAPFAPKATTEDCYAVGFPGGKGPNEKRLSFRRTWRMGEAETDRSFIRNQWYVKPEGGAYHSGGDSGGGIFNGERFIGVLTHGDPSNRDGSDLTVQSSTHAQVATFLRRDRRIRRWKCKDGQCVEEGPRDLWWLDPNVDVESPDAPITDPGMIDSDDARFAALQRQIDALTKRVQELENNQINAPPPPYVDPDEPAPAPIEVPDYSSQFDALKELIKGNEPINYETHFVLLKSLIAANKSKDYSAEFAALKELLTAKPVEHETVIRVKIYGDKFQPVDAIMTAKSGNVLVQVLDTKGRVIDEDNFSVDDMVRFKIVRDESTAAASPNG